MTEAEIKEVVTIHNNIDGIKEAYSAIYCISDPKEIRRTIRELWDAKLKEAREKLTKN